LQTQIPGEGISALPQTHSCFFGENCFVQGGHRALKVLEKIVDFSRTWKVLENKKSLSYG